MVRQQWPQLPRGAVTYSYTKLDTFTCPYRGQQKYLVRPRRKEPESEALWTGRLAHDAIGAYVARCVEQRVSTDVTAVPEVVEEVFFSTEEPHGLPLAARAEVEDIVRRVAEGVIIDFKHLLSFEEIWAIPLGDNRYFWVIADLVELHGNRARIRDWKTDRAVRPQSEVDQDFQLRVYAWGVMHQFPFVEEVDVSLFFARYGIERERSEPITRAEMSEIEADIRRRIRQIEEMETYTAIAGDHCQWCGFKDECSLLGQQNGLLIVDNEFDAQRVAQELVAIEARKKDLAEALKRYCIRGGPIKVNGLVYGYIPSESYGVDDLKAFAEACELAGLDPFDYLQASASKIKALHFDRETPATIQDLIVDKSSTSFRSKKDKGGDGDAAA